MVQSLVNPDVHYPENQTVDDEDVGYSATLCEMEIPNESNSTMLVALGKMKYTFHDRGIIYYPLYLLKKSMRIKAKIGIVEVPVKHALHILDENKEVRLDLLEEPLLFAFANQEYLERFSTNIIPTAAAKAAKKVVDNVVEEEDDDSSDSVQKARRLVAPGIFKINDRIVVPAAVPEETETEAKAAEESFDDDHSSFWVKRFFKNDRYGFHAVLGSEADSLFSCICDAYNQIGQDTTVAKLRALVALAATASVFKQRREAFEHLSKTMDDKRQRVKKVKQTLAEKERQAKVHFAKGGEEYRSVTADMRDLELQKKYTSDELAHDERLVQEMVGTEFGSVTTLAHFREFIMTSRFFPDDWAMGVLEKKLNAKFIVLSEQEFVDGDVHHVLRTSRASAGCGHHPNMYIILSLRGNKYTLVSFKNADGVAKKIFGFAELPWALKQHVAQRCAEKSGHGFQHIDHFRDLASQRGYADHDAGGADTDTDTIVFQFHRKASPSAPPGKGPHELVPVDKLVDFQPLRRIKAWRQKLDDAWPQAKFELDGKMWASVTHYTQSQRFKKKNPEYAETFALDSRSALSKSVELALKAASAAETTDTEKERQVARVQALHAKFTQNADLQQLLKATYPAKLLHHVPKHVARPDEELMALRQTLLHSS
jgi:predicted NAD-dependent protein-ADP-ribosyltransferase YbiA (DUF1768 family)